MSQKFPDGQTDGRHAERDAGANQMMHTIV